MKFSDIKYTIKDFLFPWNVLKIQNLPRSWRDRDYVLFHAMFQVFIDFIELEHPFIRWQDKSKTKGRYTDHAEMVKFVEETYGSNGLMYKDDEACAEYAERVYPVYTELLWMYKWYKDREWDIEGDCYDYSFEREREVEKKCDDMLHRIVAWRGYYWT